VPSAPQPPRRLIALLFVLGLALVIGANVGSAPAVHGQTDVGLRVLGSAPLGWDPAQIGDTTSAAVVAQVFDGLTVLDPSNNVQPALATSWKVSDDGRHIDFTLRTAIKYSDGAPITAQDFVDSWFRLLDPRQPSPLVSLLSDVAGATDYLAGRVDRGSVGLRAEGEHVLVDLARPASYFVSVTSSPSLAVVPPSMFDAFHGATMPANPVVSGAYRPTSLTDSALRLEANANYWAGAPALGAVEVVLDTNGQDPIDLFEAGQLDYTPLTSFEAAWARFDRGLGPQLRQTADLDIQFYGFDTRRPPFNDKRVRLAFAKAVDWDRIVALGDGNPAHSMVPPGMPNFDSTDYRPTYDPAAARDLLAQAGFEGGAGFPEVALVSIGFGYEPAVAAELERELGIKVDVEFYDFADLLGRQQSGEHAGFWNQVWSADYPHQHDYLGLLLETGSASNDGGWSNAAYDAEIAAAAAASDPTVQRQHYAAAQAILRDEAPVVPVEAFQGWALSRNGLLGALPDGAGIMRYSGISWSSGR
jgi:ABC-type oligopeptide transport system substrate-binding subunit